MGYINMGEWKLYVDGKEVSYANFNVELDIKSQKEDKVIFNDKKKTTVVLWKDGTKTIVKASDNDTFDRRVGYLMAFYEKNCGMSRTKANRYIDSLCKEEEL